MKTILIGSNGGLTGVYLAKQFRKMEQFTVLGADSSENSAGKFFVDKQFYLPPAKDESFLQDLIELLNKENVSFYFPTHSQEIKVVSKNEEFIKEHTDCRFCVSPYETYLALENKEKATCNLIEKGIPAPAPVELDCTEYPIIMKKVVGSGGVGTIKIDNKVVHTAYAHTTKDVAFFEVINGREFTVDCLFDSNGSLIGYNNRERVKMIGGAVMVSQNETEIDIEPWLNKLSSEWKFCGCVNFQYIYREGIPYFIDMNLRFPAGGLALTVESGLNIPRLLLDVLQGKEVPYQGQVSERKRMYRYFEEKYENI